MPLPLFAAAAAAQAGYSIYNGLENRIKAAQLKLQDTSTAGEREGLSLSRQMQASALPALGMRLNRIGLATGGTQQAARLGAGSGGDYLATVVAANAAEQRALAGLGQEEAQYRIGATQQLRRDLAVNSAREQHDLDEFSQKKSAYTQASKENFGQALNTGANFAAYQNNVAEADKDRATYLESLKSGVAVPPVTDPIDYGSPRVGLGRSYTPRSSYQIGLRYRY